MAVFDLERHYTFYASYHNTPINKFIHFIFVWPIFFSALLLLDYTPPLFPSPSLSWLPAHQFVVFNAAFFVAFFYLCFYLLMEPKAGGIATCLIVFCLLGAEAAFQKLGRETAWKVGVAVQLVSWISQFVGHGVFEKRSPALLDNLFQALLMAPFFVLLEVMETGFGYEPYAGFHGRVKAKAEENIKEFRAKKQMLLS